MATIKELNVQPGDVVDCKYDPDFNDGPYTIEHRVKDGLYKDMGWYVNGNGILEDTDEGFYIVRRKVNSSLSDRELLESHVEWLRANFYGERPLAEIIENLIDERDVAVASIRSLSSTLDSIQEECLVNKSLNRRWMDF